MTKLKAEYIIFDNLRVNVRSIKICHFNQNFFYYFIKLELFDLATIYLIKLTNKVMGNRFIFFGIDEFFCHNINIKI